MQIIVSRLTPNSFATNISVATHRLTNCGLTFFLATWKRGLYVNRGDQPLFVKHIFPKFRGEMAETHERT
jgi:hypothetical protein